MYSYNRTGPRYALCAGALTFLLLWFSLIQPLHAAEPVEIVITGIEGDMLKNVQDALTLPTGLVHDGAVDELWLGRFSKQASDKARTALEPFGYYKALITVTVEPAEKQ